MSPISGWKAVFDNFATLLNYSSVLVNNVNEGIILYLSGLNLGYIISYFMFLYNPNYEFSFALIFSDNLFEWYSYLNNEAGIKAVWFYFVAKIYFTQV